MTKIIEFVDKGHRIVIKAIHIFEKEERWSILSIKN